ncbi:hypothetical protein [Streptomyces coeruleorubidus]
MATDPALALTGWAAPGRPGAVLLGSLRARKARGEAATDGRELAAVG